MGEANVRATFVMISIDLDPKLSALKLRVCGTDNELSQKHIDFGPATASQM